MDIRQHKSLMKSPSFDDFVLEKSIFNNVFDKDIRRVYIYKKAERLAKATHLISPAFSASMSLRDRVDAVAVGLVDAAVLPTSVSRTALSRELLALSSILSIARSGGLLSPMNADLIAREAHLLLQEIAGYEEPRLLLEDVPTLSSIARSAPPRTDAPKQAPARLAPPAGNSKGHIKDISDSVVKDRTEAVLGVVRDKGKVSIKDISTLIRGVSEKTIQRELSALVARGVLKKEGERRWSTYSPVQ